MKDTKTLKAETQQLETENNYWKQSVLAEELRARYQKARYEVMHYLIESSKIEEEYKEVVGNKFEIIEQKEVTPGKDGVDFEITIDNG